MRIEFNGRKIVDTGHYICCENCPLDTNGSICLGSIFGITKDCKTGFKYEDNI